MYRQILSVGLLLAALPAFAQEPKPPQLTPEERKLEAEAQKLDADAGQWLYRGRPDEAVGLLRRSLEIRQKIYPASKYPGGHHDVAICLNNVATMLQLMGQPEQALPYYRQALEMKRNLFPVATYPDGDPSLAIGLDCMGLVLNAMGRAEEGLPHLREGLEMRRRLFPIAKYPDGHPDIAASLSSTGLLLQSTGQTEQALPFHRQALAMRQRLFPAAKYPNGHPDIAESLNNLGSALESTGQAEQALPYFRQALEMRQKLFPGGHPHLAISLSNMGFVLCAMGQMDQGLPFLQQSLEMKQKIFPAAKYPDGHPDIAMSLNNIGIAFQLMGRVEQALSYSQRALKMYQEFFAAARFPNGHPQLATSLNTTGGLLIATSQSEQGLLLHRQSLEMREKIYPASKYPDGHPDLAHSLHNLGFVLRSMGRTEEAMPFCRRAQGMYRKLYPAAKYPDGHPDLAKNLANMGDMLTATGQVEQALPLYRQSLEMQQRLLRRELVTTSEEAAFDRIRTEPHYRDAYLSATRTLKTGGDDSFAVIWPSRSLVTRLLEQRQANARAAGTATGAKFDELRGCRRRIEQLLRETSRKAEERDKLLADYADKIDKLQRELVAEVPVLNRWQELDQLRPADLAKALPPGAVFVDLINYTYVEYVNQREKDTPCYVVFVVAKDRPIQRIELEAAKEIDAAVHSWRSAIEERRGSDAATRLHERLWTKLVPHIPSGTKTLYLTADGDLARLPWAALPVGGDRVLLEAFAVAQMPHGLYLLDQLRHPRTFAGDSVFAVGGIDYGTASRWPQLPGTLAEVTAILALARGVREAASRDAASVGAVTSGAAQARYVHLATHGEFKADELNAERQRAAAALEARLRGDGPRYVAAKNPLGYVGLVLSGGEVLSGLGIVDLPLTKTQLVTLSACETGLGEYTGDEGVQGLQRAFHLAGCPNVIASLWKVNDAATAALMAKFYHEMWVNQKAPLAALREAQLTIYHHPELISDLTGERGAPKFKDAVAVKAGDPAKPQAARADTKLWAAFVLSGVGK